MQSSAGIGEKGGAKLLPYHGVGLLGKSESDHSGDEEEEHGEELEVGSEYGSAPGLLLVLAGEDSLDYELVSTPVPEAYDGRAEKGSVPGEGLVVRVPHKGGHRVAVFVYALGRTGIHHHAPAAKLLESEIQDYKRADQKDGGLEDRCLEHTFHTADDCIDGGDDYQGNGGHPEIDAQKGLESKTACHNCHADLGEHIAGK